MREAQIDDECAQIRSEGRAGFQPLRRRGLEPFRATRAGSARQRDTRDIGLDLGDLDVIVSLADDLRHAGNVRAAMLAGGRHHIAPGGGIWMQRPMRASVRLAVWLARRFIRRLAPLRGRRTRIIRRLRGRPSLASSSATRARSVAFSASKPATRTTISFNRSIVSACARTSPISVSRSNDSSAS